MKTYIEYKPENDLWRKMPASERMNIRLRHQHSGDLDITVEAFKHGYRSVKDFREENNRLYKLTDRYVMNQLKHIRGQINSIMAPYNHIQDKISDMIESIEERRNE